MQLQYKISHKIAKSMWYEIHCVEIKTLCLTNMYNYSYKKKTQPEILKLIPVRKLMIKASSQVQNEWNNGKK